MLLASSSAFAYRRNHQTIKMFLLLRKEYYFESSTQRLFQDFGSALHRKASNYDAKPLPSLQLQAADRHHLPSANNLPCPNR